VINFLSFLRPFFFPLSGGGVPFSLFFFTDSWTFGGLGFYDLLFSSLGFLDKRGRRFITPAVLVVFLPHGLHVVFLHD